MGAFFFTAKAAASVAAQRNTDRVRDVDDWRVETFVKGD